MQEQGTHLFVVVKGHKLNGTIRKYPNHHGSISFVKAKVAFLLWHGRERGKHTCQQNNRHLRLINGIWLIKRLCGLWIVCKQVLRWVASNKPPLRHIKKRSSLSSLAWAFLRPSEASISAISSKLHNLVHLVGHQTTRGLPELFTPVQNRTVNTGYYESTHSLVILNSSQFRLYKAMHTFPYEKDWSINNSFTINKT